MSDRVCYNCGNCNMLPKRNGIETRCAIDNHYIGRWECISNWCKLWKPKPKWDRRADNG